MNIETKMLNSLKAEQQRFAEEALRRPQKRDAFEYGYKVGVYEGFSAAINVLLALLEEDRTDKNHR